MSDDVVAELDRWLEHFSYYGHVVDGAMDIERAKIQRARDEIVALRRDTERKAEEAARIMRNARAAALEEAAQFMEGKGVPKAFTDAIRALKDQA